MMCWSRPTTRADCLVSGSQEVPPVAVQVDKDGDASVLLDTRWSQDFDVSSYESFECRVKVINAKKEADPALCLITDALLLNLTIGLSEQQACLSTPRSHDNPALRPAIFGCCWRIFDKLEVEHFYKEVDRSVIGIDEQGHQAEHHGSFVALRLWRNPATPSTLEYTSPQVACWP